MEKIKSEKELKYDEESFSNHIAINENFIIKTTKRREQVYDSICSPQEVTNTASRGDSFSFRYKFRAYLEFINMKYKDEVFIKGMLNLIDFIEILKAFSGNKLSFSSHLKNEKKVYNFDTFEARMVEKNQHIFLKISIGSHELYYDKFEASTLASKIIKVTSRCEVV